MGSQRLQSMGQWCALLCVSSAQHVAFHAYHCDKNLKSSLLGMTPFFRCGLSGWIFCSCQNSQCDLLDLSVLFVMAPNSSSWVQITAISSEQQVCSVIGTLASGLTGVMTNQTGSLPLHLLVLVFFLNFYAQQSCGAHLDRSQKFLRVAHHTVLMQHGCYFCGSLLRKETVKQWLFNTSIGERCNVLSTNPFMKEWYGKTAKRMSSPWPTSCWCQLHVCEDKIYVCVLSTLLMSIASLIPSKCLSKITNF